MNANMLILNNSEVLISILIDRAIIFGTLFVLLMVGSYTRNSTMDKTSTLSEMIVMSIFFALAFTLAADKIMAKIGYMIFFVVLMIGLVQKELVYMLKKYIIWRIKNFLDKSKK